MKKAAAVVITILNCLLAVVGIVLAVFEFLSDPGDAFNAICLGFAIVSCVVAVVGIWIDRDK